MAAHEHSSTLRERRLDEAVAEYLEAQGAGRSPDRQQWLARFPDLADELAGFFADLDRMNRLVAPQEPASSAAAGSASTQALPPGPLSSRSETTIFVPLPPRVDADRYALQRFYARGGMGEIWLAEDTQIGRRIAVKKLRRERGAEQDRFLFEAQITGQLEHPGIVPLHDLAADEKGNPFYVMKFVQGRSFKEAIGAWHAAKSNRDWPREVEFLRLLESFVSVCHAVAYAHSKGVLHRDIKPDNIMLGPYGETLLLDWGLAKVLGQPETPSEAGPVQLRSSGSTATQAGSVLGSPAYMAPELAAGHADTADQRTDVYLLGSTLYEILTGRPPRAGSSQLEIVDLARTTPPPPPRRIDAQIPRALEAICLKAMTYRPDDRYRTALALAEDVHRYLAGEPVSAYREPLPMRAWRWMRRHQQGLQRTAAALVVLLLAAFAIAAHRESQQSAARRLAEQQVAEFRRLAETARYLAAGADPVGENARFYDPQTALAAGQAALEIAAAWGANAERLPLEEQERSAAKEELYHMLLVLANAQEQAGTEQDVARKALLLLDRAAALGPLSPGFHRLRSRCLARLGETTQARQEEEKAQDSGLKMTAQDHFLLGESYRTQTADGALSEENREAIARAVEEYRLALRLDRRHYWAQFQLARCYLNAGREREAVQALGGCIAMRPEAPWAYSTRGLAQGLLGQFADAHADFDEALRLDPDFRAARLNRGFVLRQENKLDQALVELDAALAPPESRRLIEAAYYRAQIHLDRGQGAQALEDATAVIAHKPAFRPAYWLRARIHFHLENDDEALADLDKWLALAAREQLHPTSAEACCARGRALREMAFNLDSAPRSRVLGLALEELKRALALGAPEDDLQRDLDTLPQLLGDYAEAIDELSEALKTAPDDLDALNQRGFAYMSLKKYEQALADFHEVLRRDPQNFEAHANLGLALAQRGERAESERAAAQAMLYGGSSYLIVHHVACIYAELSRTAGPESRAYEDLALAFLERAVERYRQHPDVPDEIAYIRQELPAFPQSLRERAELKKLIGE